MSTRLLRAGICAAVCIAATIITISVGRAQAPAADQPRFVPAEVLVQFSPRSRRSAGGRRGHASACNRRTSCSVRSIVSMARATSNWSAFRLGLPSPTPCAASRPTPSVEFAEPNWIYTHGATRTTRTTPTARSGACTATPRHRRTSSAARPARRGPPATTGSAGVYVGIIDEGIDVHATQDLAATSGPTRSIPVDGIDNDGNGYVDDVHGWDFDGNNNTHVRRHAGRPRHARRRHDRRGRRERQRRRGRELERHAHLGQVPGPAAAARRRTPSRRSTTSRT